MSLNPTTIERYEVRETLGVGASGSVYLGWDPKLHREVAIKVLRGEAAREPKARERFIREARAVAALRHQNVVEVYDYSGEDSEHLYIVMERLEGDDLFNIVARHGKMPEAAATCVVHELCLALGAAHEKGVIHRDMKPENVFVTPNGRVVLTDFGIVKAIKEDSALGGYDQKTDVIGTPGFMPPEVMTGGELGPWTDIFALGVLYYNILTGELPFEGTSPMEMYRSMLTGEFRDPQNFNTSVSTRAVEILGMMLEPKSKDRVENVDRVREALRDVLVDNDVTDVRDEVRIYLSDPASYWSTAKQRTVQRLVDNLRVAQEQEHSEEVFRYKTELRRLDPDNAVLGAQFERDDELAPRPRPSAELSVGESDGERVQLWLVGVVLTTLALAGAALVMLRGADGPAPEVSRGQLEGTPADLPPEAAPDPAKNTESKPGRDGTGSGTEATRPSNDEKTAKGKRHARVSVAFRGRFYAVPVFVDGEFKERTRRGLVLAIPPGSHTIEFRGKHKRPKITRRFKAGEAVRMIVDFRRESIVVR